MSSYIATEHGKILNEPNKSYVVVKLYTTQENHAHRKLLRVSQNFGFFNKAIDYIVPNKHVFITASNLASMAILTGMD